ncbi:MAG: protoporphyrinogen oxidase [Bacteroidota bacterium]
MNQASVDVVVLGAGLSGLSAALYLQEQGKSVAVLEKKSEPGGVISSVKKGAYLLDFGANSSANHPALLAVLKLLGAENQLIDALAAAGNRYLVRDGKLHLVRPSPAFIWSTDLLSRKAKWRLAKEPFVRKKTVKGESVADFFIRRLGPEAYAYMVEPVLGGIYAGDPHQMNMEAVMPQVMAWEQEHGSLFKGMTAARKNSPGPRTIHSFQGGMQQLPRLMAEHLGTSMQYRQEVLSLRQEGDAFLIDSQGPEGKQRWQSKQVVWALPATQGALLQELSGEAFQAMDQIPYVPMGMLFLAFPADKITQSRDGFGFLVPKLESVNLLGAIWNSAIFADRAPEGSELFTLFVGGGRRPMEQKGDREEAFALARKEFCQLMGIQGEHDFEYWHFWEKAIPQYGEAHMGYRAIFDRAEQATPGLKLIGNFRAGVSVGDCLAAGQEAASALA